MLNRFVSGFGLRGRRLAGTLLFFTFVACGLTTPASSQPVFLPAVDSAGLRPHFALLVGVNEQLQPADREKRVRVLQGPANDVGIIRELITGQYGFPDDQEHVLTLIGREATRDSILAAFESHLIHNAELNSDSVVLFYFSGHGSRTPDQNADEGDGVDETLVAFDSTQDGGQDILDDEINELLQRLSQHTSNITLIFDSCNSGTASRDARLFERGLPLHPSTSVPQIFARDTRGEDGVIPNDRRFTVISSSIAADLSYETDLDTPIGIRRHGLFTFFLTQALKRSPNLTYVDAVKEAETGIALFAPSQHPQAEGDVYRLMFKGPENQEDPFIEVVGIQEASFDINIGEAHGVKEGAILAVYDPHAVRLKGDENRLGNAHITSVGRLISRAEVLDFPQDSLSIDAKVRLVTPFSGTDRARVFVPVSAISGLEAETTVLKEVVKILTLGELVSVTEDETEASLHLRIGCASNYILLSEWTKSQDRLTCQRVLYVAPSDQDVALHGLLVTAEDDVAASRLAFAVENRVRQDNLRQIVNAQSPLNVNVVYVRVDTRDGVETEIEVPGTELVVPIDEVFKLRVENESTQDVFVSVVMLGTSGRIKVITPALRGEQIASCFSPAGERLAQCPSIITDPRTVGPPLGRETYKVLVTTEPVNFLVLEQPPGAARSVIARELVSSPLAWLLSQATTDARDSTAAANITLSDWTTARVDLSVEPKL